MANSSSFLELGLWSNLSNIDVNDTFEETVEETTLKPTKMVLETLKTTAYGAYDKKDAIPADVDHFFLLIMSIIIFFMQCGFAFMEAGAVR